MKRSRLLLLIVFATIVVTTISMRLPQADNALHPCSSASTSADGVICSSEDSAMIVRLLAEGAQQPIGTNLMLYYGYKFLNVPYVGHTLEVPYNSGTKNASEQLVVNLHELDCTTFVETVLTLTLTTNQHKTTFADYCNNLRALRYRNGIINDYASRNHYFTTWIDNATQHGFVKLIGPAESSAFKSRLQTINYMTQHPEAYAALRMPGGNHYLANINQEEKRISRREYYLPTSELAKSQSQLSFIKDGDILALETLKDGLDVSHLGIAVWGKDHKLHLLNASSIHKRVLTDSLTLYQYQLKQKRQIGIRVLRAL